MTSDSDGRDGSRSFLVDGWKRNIESNDLAAVLFASAPMRGFWTLRRYRLVKRFESAR